MIKKPTNTTINEACTLWHQGQVVAIPTETVYGLAADAEQEAAVAKIFTIKERPRFNPLILHVSSLEQVEAYAYVSPPFIKAASIFWPGPLTFVLKRRPNTSLSYLVTAGLDTIAIRLPSHPVAQALIQSYKKPLAAPSANKFNKISPTSAADVATSLGNQVPLIIDGGSPTIGLESTILDLTEVVPTILRPGGVGIEALSKVLGEIRYVSRGSPIKAPGMLTRHYAPSLPLRLNALDKNQGEAMLGFGEMPCDLNLSRQKNLQEAASNLFRMMRLLDHSKYKGLAVAPIPFEGLGLAINDRLSRAAADGEEGARNDP